jgi:hypothetical protein
VGAPLVVASCIGSISWLWNLQSVSSAHETKLSVHDGTLQAHKELIAKEAIQSEGRFDRVDKQLDRLENKFDHIIDRIGK